MDITTFLTDKPKINIFSQLRNREVNASRIKLKLINIYKLFYDFQGDNNPNKGFKCIFDDFFKLSSTTTKFFEKNLTTTLKNVKYISDTPVIIDLTSDREYNTKEGTFRIYDFIDYINSKIAGVDIKKKINNFYISEDKETLYIIEDAYLVKFNIENQNILSILNKLPYISSTDNMINLKKLNRNIYRSTNDVQMFKFRFNGSNVNIVFNIKNRDTDITLDGNIKDWYYTDASFENGSIIRQIIYITHKDYKKFNKLCLKNKTSFKINLHRVYKILYESKDVYNSNLGFKCIYKDIFKSKTNKKNVILDFFESFSKKTKITKMCYCSTAFSSISAIIYDLNALNWDSTNEYFKFFFNDYLKIKFHIDILKTFDYNKLYISEDETILYYIEDDYINNFDVLNKSFLEVLDNMPNIEYSTGLSTTNQSDYYTITLNNNFTEVFENILDLDYTDIRFKKYICKYDVQLFNFKDNQIIKTEIPADTTFKLEGNIHNWYYTLTTLKKPASNNKGLKINSVINTKENILQLIYITPKMIDKYKQMFIELKIPVVLYIENKITGIFNSIKASIGGGNMKLRRLLKSY